MNYNVYFKANFRYSLLDLDQEALNLVIEAYKKGKKSFTIDGEKYFSDNLHYFKIYTNANGWNDKEIIRVAKQNNLWVDSLGTFYVSERLISQLGDDVTKQFIKNVGFGDEKKEIEPKAVMNDSYIHYDRIQELREINSKFDLSKLIRLCEELNSNFENQNYYSVAMNGRAIIDHVPPIFGFKNFDEVSNNYGSKSIRGSLLHLNESMRNIGDGILHSHVRKSEALPNSNQVKFSQDLDVLLAEVVNALK